MPGTCGSFAAAVAAPFVFMPLPYWARTLVLVLVFFIGVAASGKAEELLGVQDPGSAVIDEVFGQWLTYFPFAALSWQGLAAGFILFRIFDITKPWPIRASEDWLPGGWSIMLDDGLAAVYAMVGLFLAQRFLL